MMTRFQAIYIKYCRVRLECSWRAVYAMYVNRYTLRVTFNLSRQFQINQIKGRELCNEAELLLGESFDEEDVIF